MYLIVFQYYAWNATLNLWHTPENTGRYEVHTFLISSVPSTNDGNEHSS